MEASLLLLSLNKKSKNMKNKNRAFSLIELSIVILIIGILIAGVTQGSRLVFASKLQTAQNVTESSPVQSIKGLLLWLEPTKDGNILDSSSVQNIDKGQVARWRDNNPQLAIPTSFTTTASSAVTYKAISGINGLPSLVFTNANTGFLGTVISAPFSAYTVFAVVRSTDLTAANTVVFNGTTGTNGFGVAKATTGFTTLKVNGTVNTDAVSGNSTVVGVPEIISATIAPNSLNGVAVATPAVKTYKNGKAGISATPAFMVAPTGNICVGNDVCGTATLPFVGEISEVILFDNVLSDTDRQSIEKYLSKKYAIAVTQ